MKTLEEIKEILKPVETVDFIELAKDLIIQTYGENKLISFNRIYMYGIGDPNAYLVGLGVYKNQLISFVDVVYGGDTDYNFIGISFDGDKINKKTGIGIPSEILKKVCSDILNKKKITEEIDLEKLEGIKEDRIWPDFFYDEFYRPLIKEMLNGADYKSLELMP